MVCAFLTEEKSTKRLIEAFASNSHPSAGKHIPTARKVLQCSQGSHRPPLAVRELIATGKSAPAGARLSGRTRYSFGVFRRGLRTPAVRKHVPGADETCSWLALTIERNVRGFFSFFSCPHKKRTCFSFTKGEEYVLFSAGRKDTKRVKSKLEMIYTHLKCSNQFKLRRYAMLRIAGQC